MFSKSSVFAVVALVTFLSLGALLFPQVGQAQCIWDCDLGSDPSFNPWGNSPQALDIAYCFDSACVVNNLSSIIGPIPTANTSVAHTKSPAGSCNNNGTTNVTISGNVVAWLRDASLNVVPGSPAQAFLLLTIKCVIEETLPTTTGSTLHRPITPGEARTDVFDAQSSITIFAPGNSPIPLPDSLKSPSGWTGCPSTKAGILSKNCGFPLGIVEFKNETDLVAELPADAPFAAKEVYRAQEFNPALFVGVRDCKGDATDLSKFTIDPKTIACSVGGGQASALREFDGNWSGANAHTFNPKSGQNSFDIDLSTLPNTIGVLPNTVFASANGGIPIAPSGGCNAMPSQDVERCFFTARDFHITCKTGDSVNIVVTGQLTDLTKFESMDLLLKCSNK